MIADFINAFDDLKIPSVRWAILACVLMSVVVIIALPWTAWAVLASMQLISWGWLDGVLDVTGAIITTILAILLFPIIMTALTGLIAEYLLTPMEQRRHPDLPPPHDLPYMRRVMNALGFLVTAFLLTLAVLIGGFFLVGLNVLLAWMVNAYLLSREFIEMVALRRVSPAAIKAWRRQNRTAVMLRGLILAGLFVIPVLNLIAPVLAAMMTSHWLARTDIYANAEPNRLVE